MKIAKEVVGFWKKIDKFVVFKKQTKIDARNRETMDRHLDFLVTQTEKFSSILAKTVKREGVPAATNEGPNRGAGEAKEAPEPQLRCAPSPNSSAVPEAVELSALAEDVEDKTDSEFEDAGESEDDENTLDEEEQWELSHLVGGNKKEAQELEDEALLPIEELLKRYRDEAGEDVAEEPDNTEHGGATTSPGTAGLLEDQSESEGEEFVGDDEEDDEETLENDEKMEDADDSELKDLEDEANMPLEQLIAKYSVAEVKEEGDTDGPKPERSATVNDLAAEIGDDEDSDSAFDDDGEEDDEETMDAEERDAKASDVNEGKTLEEEANIPLEELLARYAQEAGEEEETDSSSKKISHHAGSVNDLARDISDEDDTENDSAFDDDGEEDDEETLDAEEAFATGRDDNETQTLEDEANMPLEELLAKYAGEEGEVKSELPPQPEENGVLFPHQCEALLTSTLDR